MGLADDQKWRQTQRKLANWGCLNRAKEVHGRKRLAASSAMSGRKLTWVWCGWCTYQSYSHSEKHHPKVHDCGQLKLLSARRGARIWWETSIKGLRRFDGFFFLLWSCVSAAAAARLGSLPLPIWQVMWHLLGGVRKTKCTRAANTAKVKERERGCLHIVINQKLWGFTSSLLRHLRRAQKYLLKSTAVTHNTEY